MKSAFSQSMHISMHYHCTNGQKKFILHVDGLKDEAKQVQGGDRDMADKVFCNGCGRELRNFGEKEEILEDVFEGKKQWGYFSKKDMMFHSFLLCEECYDDMVSRFAIPPKVEEVTEL